jgi:type II secretory pathway component PulM
MDVEERAKLMGWVPKEDFKGDPDRWTPAEDYVERADHVMPIMKAQMSKYEEQLQSTGEELKSTRTELANLKTTMEKVIKVNSKVSEAAYQRAVETIRKEQRQAINDSDGDRFEQLERDKEKLEAARPEKIEVEEKPVINPEFEEWVKENEWYNTDTDLRDYCEGVAPQVAAQNPHFTNKQLYAAVKERAMNLFPDKFENPNRKEKSAVASSDRQGEQKPAGKGKFTNLPKEAKDAWASMEGQGLKNIDGSDYTKEDYAKDFFEGE